jgi:hypothetical protein
MRGCTRWASVSNCDIDLSYRSLAELRHKVAD